MAKFGSLIHGMRYPNQANRILLIGPVELNNFLNTSEKATPDEIFASRKHSATNALPWRTCCSPNAKPSEPRNAIGKNMAKKRMTFHSPVQNSGSRSTTNRLCRPENVGASKKRQSETDRINSQTNG